MKRSLWSAVVAVTLACSMASCGPAGPANPAGGFKVTITGESGAQDGFAFPATDGPAFIDGWELKFESVVVFIDKVTVSENPDKVAGDQSQTGDLVAQLDGPFVVDLVKEGPISAEEDNGKAWELGVIANQNKKGGIAFDATQKYAFGYELAKASSGAKNIGGVDAAVASTMVSKGYAVWMKGTAEWKGTNCRTTNAAYDFNRVPKKINFEFGFATPVTFKNCINPQLMPAESRGIQGKKGADTVAQVTLHLDHPFWEALEEDAPLRFDLIAAQKSVAAGMTAPASASVTAEELASLGFVAGKDAQSNDLPWRYCGDMAAGERTTGNVSYNPNGVAVSASGGAAGLKGLADYMSFNLSTFGHLNNDGLCFPARNYPAPSQP